MIDIENKVYTILKTALGNNVDTSSMYVESPTSFPHVSIMQEDSVTYLPTRDNTCNENHALITFGINIYTEGNKAAAKSLLGIIDDTMIGMDFERDMVTEIPNEQRGIYRIFVRYLGLISKAIDINGTPTCFIFRR